MFDRTYKLPKSLRNGYDLVLPIDSHWGDTSTTRKVLIVIETVDGEDLREKTLLFSRSRVVVNNVLAWSVRQAKQDTDQVWAFAAVNFNDTKFFDRPKDSWGQYRKKFARRVQAVIDELKPTSVIVFGDGAMEAMYPKIDIVTKKRGWVFKQVTEGGHKYKVTGSLDLERLYRPKKDEVAFAKLAEEEGIDDDDEEEGNKDTYGLANLLFYVCRNVINNLCGRNLFDLSDIKVKTVYVDTIEKFNTFYTKLKTAEVIALDTETKNLTVHHNAIHTLQIAFSSRQAYFIPMRHPEAKWNPKEISYIYSKLRRYFQADADVYPLKYIITQFGQFDLRMLRQDLHIPVIQHACWDIRAGEFCLDENLKYLRDFGTRHGGLEQIFLYYGNDHYKTAKFSKEDRGNANLTKLSNPEFIEYGSMDVQSIFGIHLMQQERAKRLKVGAEPFLSHYLKLVTIQMSDTIHTISHMQQKGAYVDRKYLKHLMGKESPLLKLMHEIKTDLYKLSEIQQANKMLVAESNNQASQGGLFNKIPWVFGLSKPAHRILLFFTVMQMKVLQYTKEKKPKVDKFFIKTNSNNPIVEKFGRWVKLSKLWGTYVKGWATKMDDSPDSRIDSRLRPDYDFFPVVTGRLNSSKPSLQQVPTRGAESKYIKHSFTAQVGHLYIKYDYSAHEVRIWALIAGDFVLAGVFRIGQKLRQAFRRTPTDALKDQIKKEGDIHIINVKFFFGILVDKTHLLRDAIKAVVFGVIYGKGATALARDIAPKAEKIAELKKAVQDTKVKIKASTSRKERATLAELLDIQTEELTANEERAEDPVGFARDLIEKLFARFEKGSKWLDWTAEHARKTFYTYGPTKMRRNLFANMTGIKSFMSAMDRRAKNSPIQGFSSQIGISAARLIAISLWKLLKRLNEEKSKKMKMLPVEVEKFVHDANHGECPYRYVLHYIHVMQYEATYGVAEHYLKKFSVKFPVEPEIEIEIGASEDNMIKWDWSAESLPKIIREVLVHQEQAGTLAKGKVDDTLALIMKPYDNPKLKRYLDRKFPILGVRDNEEKETADAAA